MLLCVRNVCSSSLYCIQYADQQSKLNKDSLIVVCDICAPDRRYDSILVLMPPYSPTCTILYTTRDLPGYKGRLFEVCCFPFSRTYTRLRRLVSCDRLWNKSLKKERVLRWGMQQHKIDGLTQLIVRCVEKSLRLESSRSAWCYDDDVDDADGDVCGAKM